MTFITSLCLGFLFSTVTFIFVKAIMTLSHL